MDKQQATELVKKHENLVIVTTYNIIFTNDIVCSNVIEMMQDLKKNNLYKKEVKMYANKIEAERKKYERLLNSILGDSSDFFADANDLFVEEVQNSVDSLYWAIKGILDKNNVDNSAIIAKMELMRTLCDFSCAQYKQRINDLVKVNPRFKGFHVDYMNMETMNKYAFEMMKHVKVGKTINLNTKEVELAMDVLAMKLANPEIIAKSINV